MLLVQRRRFEATNDHMLQSTHFKAWLIVSQFLLTLGQYNQFATQMRSSLYVLANDS